MLSTLGFIYPERSDAQSMYRAGKLLGECFIDEPVTVDSTLSIESRSDDPDPEMRLAPGARARMPGVFVALIDDLELPWRKCRLQLLCNPFPDLTRRHLLLLDLLIWP
jgi:hypothetical protein